MNQSRFALSRNKLLGDLCERVYQDFMTERGAQVTTSVSVLDNTKDMIVDGKTTEVKGQAIYRNKNAFTFMDKQARKLATVDVAIFISVPYVYYPDEKLDIYEWPKHLRSLKEIVLLETSIDVASNETKRHIPVRDCNLIGSYIDQKIVQEASGLLSSKYKNFLSKQHTQETGAYYAR